MAIESLIPIPDSIPVAWGWFWFFLIVTFFLHLIFLNVTIGTAFISFVKSMGKEKRNLKTAKTLATKLPYTIAFTITAGVAPLLFIQVIYGQFIYTSSILMASYWLSVIILLLVAYYSAYIYDFKFDALGSIRSLFIGIAVLMFLVIAFFFSNNMTLMLMPEKWQVYFSNPKGTLLNLGDPTLYPRYLHFIAASIANGGLFLALLNDVKARKSKNNSTQSIHTGLRWFAVAFVFQMIIGFWFILSLPKDIRFIFMGQNIYATTLLILGLLGACLSLGLSLRKKVRACAVTVLSTMAIMILIRDVVRTAYMKPYFHASNLKVIPQYSPMLLFTITLILGVLVIIYMLKLASRAGKEV